MQAGHSGAGRLRSIRLVLHQLGSAAQTVLTLTVELSPWPACGSPSYRNSGVLFVIGIVHIYVWLGQQGCRGAAIQPQLHTSTPHTVEIPTGQT